MALLEFSAPPEIPNAKYPDFLEWLHENQFDRLCCYCLLRNANLEVEHYLPKQYPPATDLVNNPSNLMLACAKCNRGKWDYHPNHKDRNKQKDATHGHMALDPRVDEYSNFLAVENDGTIKPLSGDSQARAAWHIGLTLLDFGPRDRFRKELLSLRDAAEKVLTGSGYPVEIREHLLNDFASKSLFYRLFGVAVSDELMHEASSRPKRLLVEAIAVGAL